MKVTLACMAGCAGVKATDILSNNTISCRLHRFIYRIMKARKNIKPKTNTKFVRINNSTWIEADVWIPDEVARTLFLQKLETPRNSTYLGQLKDFVSNIST
jgi:hypothetical protein